MSDGVTRRGFLRGLIDARGRRSLRYPLTATEARPDRRTRVIPMLRPPGAVEERLFLELCTRCGDCAEACPHDALHPAPERFRTSAGTPTFDPLRQPCLMCEDTPCIEACAPRALDATAGLRMGTARIDPQVCIAFQGTTCSACVERCPVPGAIALEGGRPVIDESACTGCGVCRHVCPAPQNAVAILPTFVRSRPAP